MGYETSTKNVTQYVCMLGICMCVFLLDEHLSVFSKLSSFVLFGSPISVLMIYASNCQKCLHHLCIHNQPILLQLPQIL